MEALFVPILLVKNKAKQKQKQKQKMYLIVPISSYNMVVALGRIAARYSIRQLKNTPSNDSYKCALFVQYLRTMIVAISHHDMVGAALNRDLAGILELAMVASIVAKGRKKSTFAIKHLSVGDSRCRSPRLCLL